MDAQAIIEQIESDGKRLIEVARSDLDAVVPTCAGWNLRDLAGHMGRVHAMVATYVAGRATGPLPVEQLPQPPTNDTAVDFAADALTQLTTALAGIDPDTEIWNWSPRPDAGFYFRRILHETSVHRWDAENAIGDTGPVEGEQGSDGVDEFFEFVLPNAQKRKRRELPASSLHVHRSDGNGEWFVQADGDKVLMERAHIKGDAAVRGPGGALFLAMWNRLSLDDASLSVMGDKSVAQAWAALAP